MIGFLGCPYSAPKETLVYKNLRYLKCRGANGGDRTIKPEHTDAQRNAILDIFYILMLSMNVAIHWRNELLE